MASSLLVKLGLDAAEFVRGLDRAEKQMQGLVTATAKQSAAIDRQIKSLERQAATVGMTTREMKLYELAQRGATTAQLTQANAALRTVESYNSIRKAATLAGSAIGLSFAALPVLAVAFFQSIVKGVDDMNDLKDATGSTIENISALDDIFQRTGVGAESVGTVLTRMNKVLNDTDPGKKAANIIKGIGLEVEALKKLDPAEAARQMAVAFSKFADDGAKGRAFIELFGKGIREIGPAMNELAKQTSLVPTVTTKAAEEAEKYRQSLASLSKDALDLARNLTGPVVTAFNDMNAAMKQTRKEGEGLFASIVAGQKSLLSSIGRGIAGLAGFDAPKPDSQRRSSGFVSGAMTAGDFARSDRSNFVPSLGDFKDDEKAKKIAKTVSEAQRYLETLQKLGEKTHELTNLEEALLNIQKKRLEGNTPKLTQEIIAAAKVADQVKRNTELMKLDEKVRGEAAEIMHRNNAEHMAEAASIAEGNKKLEEEIALLGADEIARAAINNAMTQSLITRKELQMENDASNAALKEEIELLKKRQRLTTEKADIENFQGVQKHAQETFEKFKQETEKASEFAKRASENIQDALGDTLLRTLKGDFQSIGQLWNDLILKMIAQALAARLNEKLFGTNGLGGLLGPALDAIFGGGATGGGSVPGGGFNGGPGNNPSAFTASVGSLEVAASMAKNSMAPTVINNNQFGSNISRNELATWGESLKEQTKAEIMQLQRNGHFQNA